MAYLGNRPAEAYSAFQKQDFSTSATTSYTLDHPVSNQNEIALFINFVRQEPTAAYTASGTTLTLTSATSSSDDMYCVYLGKAVQTVNPPSGSVGTAQLGSDAVTEAKIADSAVENEHLNVNVITGQTAETSIATDDTILIHDTSASALRKMTRANFVSGIGGANTPNFSVYKSGDQTGISANTWTKVTGFVEEYDPQSTWDNSNDKFTPAVAGKYFMYATMYLSMNDGSASYIAIAKNGTRIIETVIPSGRTSAHPMQLSAILESDADDYFEFYVRVPVSSGVVYSNGVQTKCGAFKIIE